MANRIQQKRSSIKGKRPNSSYLEPGELALNTNANDPGLFFEGNDGSIVKVGPTHIGSVEPDTNVGYGHGEAWYDSGNGTFKLYSSTAEKWLESFSAPYGGSTTLLYVGSQFPEASDDLSNDGRARPFATLNRACIEIARRSILQNRSDEPFAEQFVIMLLPGNNTVYNELGTTLSEFENDVPAFEDNQVITPEILRAFNPSTGGLILPRGVSITSFDTRKTLIRPSYYPKWNRFDYEFEKDTLENRTNIFKWTGGSSVSGVTIRDKKEEISVVNITGSANEVAELVSFVPHGFRSYLTRTQDFGEDLLVFGDQVRLNYPEQVKQSYEGDAVVTEGTYYVQPLDSLRFRLLDPATLQPLLRKQLPFAPDPGTQPKEFLKLSYTNTSHHRLSAFGFVTKQELVDYYSKVQRSFSKIYFGGRINDANVADFEVEIVTDLPEVATADVNDVTHTAPGLSRCEIRTNFGMNGVVCDGSLVKGTKAVAIDDVTYFSVQNDPEVYEVYYDNVWVSLKEAVSRFRNVPESTITSRDALDYRVENVELSNLRKFYRSTADIPKLVDLSSGLTDDLSDTRTSALLATNKGGIRVENCDFIGADVHMWAKSGGRIFSSNSSTVFGGQALRAEGFSGIGTGGGAESVDKGFSIKGIRRPANIHFSELINAANYKYLYLNGNIVAKTANSITLSEPINVRALLPFTLRPGTVIWVADVTNNDILKATIGANPLSDDRLTLNLENTDNEIFSANLDDLSPPFIRRFIDPRPEAYKSYSLWVENTTPGHRPPAPGSMVRYAEVALTRVSPLLRSGKQLDPGQNGGWNHLFTVQEAFTTTDGNNPNIAFPPSVVPNSEESYYISLRLCDSFSPWMTGVPYSSGTHVTYSNRPFQAEFSDVDTFFNYPPFETASVFTLSKNFEFCQPVDETFIAESLYRKALDPYEGSYTSEDVYLRGVSVPPSDYAIQSAIDYDDGSSTLGLRGSGEYSNFVDPVFIDPDYSHSKLAVKRFLMLLGFNSADLDSILSPQRWSKRNLPISSFPDLEEDGYALSEGEWPIEFNQPSVINSSGHQWESPGYADYSKGLETYRDSQLSSRLRFDNVLTEVWGGIVTAQGLTDSGEFVVSRLAQVSSNGQATRPQLNVGDSVIIVDPASIDNGPYTPTVF